MLVVLGQHKTILQSHMAKNTKIFFQFVKIVKADVFYFFVNFSTYSSLTVTLKERVHHRSTNVVCHSSIYAVHYRFTNGEEDQFGSMFKNFVKKFYHK